MPLRIKVLHAEDDINDQEYLDQLLSPTGLARVFPVSSGEEVVEYLVGNGSYADRARYPYPDVLLLDLGLPRMDGFAVLDWIASQRDLPRVSVYVLTGLVDAAVREKLESRDISGFFEKPLSLAQVASIVQDQKR